MKHFERLEAYLMNTNDKDYVEDVRLLGRFLGVGVVMAVLGTIGAFVYFMN